MIQSQEPWHRWPPSPKRAPTIDRRGCSYQGRGGKSTLALQLAIARARAGRDVLLVDGDTQASAITAVTLRAEAGRQPALAAGHYPDGPTLRAQVIRQRDKYEDVVLDVGGRDSGPLRAALLLADLVLVPIQPRGLDVWSLATIAGLIQEARGLRDGLAALAVINQADAGASADNTDAAAAVADYPPLRLADAPLVRRKAVANAAARGLSVDELDTIDPKASQELARLVETVFHHQPAVVPT